jgi:uncharacterized protein
MVTKSSSQFGQARLSTECRSWKKSVIGHAWRFALAGILTVTATALGGCGSLPADPPPTPVHSLLGMRHHDVVIQKWDLSCGAAALDTLLRYEWGDPVTEQQIALGLMQRKAYIEHPELIKIREGFSLLDLKRYVDEHGFKGIGFGGMDLNDLIKYAPIMVPINALGYNHFVVFRGVYGNRVLLADPAWGNRTMTIDQFRRIWLDFGKPIGRVGFVVESADGRKPLTELAAKPSDFVTLD